MSKDDQDKCHHLDVDVERRYSVEGGYEISRIPIFLRSLRGMRWKSQ